MLTYKVMSLQCSSNLSAEHVFLNGLFLNIFTDSLWSSNVTGDDVVFYRYTKSFIMYLLNSSLYISIIISLYVSIFTGICKNPL